MENQYDLRVFGRSYNPSNWFYNPYYMINRIYYICGGTAYYRNSIQLKKGFAYIFPANADFAVSQEPDDPVDHVFFDFFSYQSLNRQEYIEKDLNQMPSLQHIFLAAMEDFRNEAFCQATGHAYFSLITALLHSDLSAPSQYCAFTRMAIQCIHKSDIQSLTVNSVAAHICVNVNHLIRCFRKDTLMTPHKYIAMYKADMATSMISRGESITSVAETIGFSSVSAFSTFYKNERHISPSEIDVVSLNQPGF